MKKIVLAGGSGYIGSVLADYFKCEFREVVILSRRPHPQRENIRTVIWDAKTPGAWTSELEGAVLLINLTGKNVNCAYNEKNKKEILDSRLDSTNVLGQALAKTKNPPKTWIQIASATIYRDAEDRPMDEDTGEIGEGFSIDICKKWEEVFWQQQVPGIRKILLRTSIVLGKKDGAFPRLVNLARFGLGGRQGSGNQMVSWIHDQDLAKIISWIANDTSIEGTFNATAPNPISNSVLMKTICKMQGAFFGLPSPEWLLSLGAKLIGTETELIMKSRWVIPKKLEERGFKFQFNRIEHAVADLLSRK